MILLNGNESKDPLPNDFADRARLIAGDRLDPTPLIPAPYGGWRRALGRSIRDLVIAVFWILAFIGAVDVLRLFFGE